MIITAFYYLSYPDYSVDIPDNAQTMMYVEYGNEGDTHESFQGTVKLNVCTPAYIAETVGKSGAVVLRNLLIVQSLDDKWMADFLQQNLELLIDVYGNADAPAI